mmetsp:Transcript_44337/g.172451  ORF Transcript_44337/g.172451 Transcript_44337/m.172451 type:complete len:222 (-) Transcript_44337:248-913(-)|eukprot:CAMPEP_0113969374 /NCGR_PEP_ID=MMETSP0011_2-20120614/10270_1 /TAXON_ID=101924 /ORGANISM="Rhodosorus marinus" /LENGTH=221 /DNA_ID=CAMNT_0000983001 /DNA_START=77 /DNA_END=742 /DNA_ORIENTATION=+ /assembly_acc=CAM_ASM_000156
MRIGETFKDVCEGKKAIKRYCFEYEVAYYVVSSDKKRFAIQCPSRKEDKDGRCQFHMNLTSMYGGGARLIKYKPHHPFCSAKAKVGHEGLVQEAIYVLENVEDATPNDVISSIRYSHGMTVPYRTAWHILTKLRKERQITAKPNSSRRVTCSRCHEHGHNSRTCSTQTVQAPQHEIPGRNIRKKRKERVEQVEDFEPYRKPRTVRCSKCGGAHYSKTPCHV